MQLRDTFLFFMSLLMARRLRKVGLDVLTVLAGTILLCIAFQLLTAGLKELLPGLDEGAR